MDSENCFKMTSQHVEGGLLIYTGENGLPLP
jgi:hypothetical protein